MSGSPQKRLNSDPNAAEAKAKKGKVVDDDHDASVAAGNEDPKTAIRRQHIELERLVTAMELEEAPEPSSWQSISMRGERAQTLWKHVNPHLTDQRHRAALELRVQRVCQRATEICNELAQEDTDDPVQRIFFKKQEEPTTAAALNEDKPQAAVTHVAAAAPAVAVSLSAPVANGRQSSTTNDTGTTVAPPPSIQDLQKTQREQMETAISQMASQMKEETTKIHSTLQQQTTGILTDMEDAAADNVEQVGKVAKDVKEHVAKSWKRSIGTWTMLFTIVGAFIFCVITIQLAPKRPGACLFFCNEHQQSSSTAPATKATVDESVQSAPLAQAEQNCDMDMNGDCLPNEKDIAAEEYSNEVAQESDGGGGADMARDSDMNLVGDSHDAHLDEISIPVDGLANDMLTEYMETVGDAADDRDGKDDTTANDVNDIEFPVDGQADDILKEYMETVEAVHNRPQKVADRRNAAAAGGDLMDDPFAGFEAVNAAEKSEETPFLNKQRPSLSDLHSAVVKEDVELIKEYLLADPSFVNQGDENKWTLLHMAVHEGRERMVEALLALDADPSLETMDGHSSLDMSIARHGLEHLITSQLRSKLLERQQFTSADFRKAAELGQVDLVRDFLKVKPQYVNEGDQNNWNALHLSARAGHTDVVQILIAGGADATLATVAGKRPLDIALERLGSDHPITGMLQRAIAAPEDTVEAAANDDDSGIGIAVDAPLLDDDEDKRNDEMNGEATAEYDSEDIREGDDDVVDDATLVKIQSAAAYGDVEELKNYLATHAELKDAMDENGWSSLHVAASNGQVGSLRALLQAGCNPWAENGAQETPFDIAFSEFGDGHPATLILNEAQTADLNDIQELMDGIERGDADSVRSLVQSKPYFSSQVLTATALHRAIASDHVDCVRVLLEGGWELDVEDQEGRSAYDVAEELYEDDHPIISLLDDYSE